MIVGATPENDYQMMAVTQALYENYGLKRVFYSAYVPVNDDSCLPSVTARPPLLRAVSYTHLDVYKRQS